MVNACHKGKRGEDEATKWLKKHFDIDVRRTHFQASGHSADIRIKDFLFEVKRHEKPNTDNFWYQLIVAKKYDKDKDIIPVVMFRQNRKKWRFLLPAKLIGVEFSYIELSERVFIEFAKKLINK